MAIRFWASRTAEHLPQYLRPRACDGVSATGDERAGSPGKRGAFGVCEGREPKPATDGGYEGHRLGGTGVP